MTFAAACRRRPLAAAAAFYALLAAACTFPQAALLTDGLPLDPADNQPYEDPYLNAWILAWGARAAIVQPAHIFDANTFWPRANTLAYSDHMLGWLPVSIPLFWLSRNAILVHNVILLLSFAACGWAAFLLAREILGAAGPALVAGVVFGFCPFRFEEYGHVQVLSAQWMPLALWCLHRWFERMRPGAAFPWKPYAGLVACGAMQSLCSAYFSIYFPVFVACFAAAAWLWRREPGRTRRAAWILLAPVLWTLLVSPTLMPYLKLRRQMGFQRDLYHNIKYSATPSSFFACPQTNRLYGATGLMRHQAEACAFMGFTAMALAAAALVSVIRRKEDAETPPAARRVQSWTRVYLACGAVMALLALGPRIRVAGSDLCPGPYMLLYKYVPGFDGLRAPGRFMMLVMLCASVAAAAGLHAWRRRLRGRARAWAPAAAAGLLLVEYASVPLPMTKAATGDRIPAVYRWLARQQPQKRIVEVPFDLGLEDMKRMYYSTYHWHHLVNGKSGFRPPESTPAFLSYAGPTRLLAALMAEMDIDYVVADERMMKGLTRAYAKFPWFTPIKRFGQVTVFRFDGRRVGRVRMKVRPEDLAEVPASAWRPSANVHPEIARLVQDGSPATYWETGVNQEAGMEFRIALKRPRPLRLIRIEFGLHADEAPWAMELSVSGDGRRWRVVYGPGSSRDMMAWLYWSALARPRDPVLDLPLPEGLWRGVRMRLMGGAFAGWIMAEVRLFETPGPR